MWPYKLTTSLLSRLQQLYPGHFSLETNTPVSDMSRTEDGSFPYVITTSRGVMRAQRVVHCTNGHASHLLPGLRGIIFPLRGQMSAQTPGTKFKAQGESRSWIIHYAEGFDYLTQLPVSENDSNGEMMLGGGIIPGTKSGLAEVGVRTDDTLNARIKAHLSGALRALFQEDAWGAVPEPMMKSMWTGIMGFSADDFPWVGRLPQLATHRRQSSVGDQTNDEWIAAGFTGEGMVHAWLCGKAVAQMMQRGSRGEQQSRKQDTESWFPESFLVSDERIKRARRVCDEASGKSS